MTVELLPITILALVVCAFFTWAFSLDDDDDDYTDDYDWT